MERTFDSYRWTQPSRVLQRDVHGAYTQGTYVLMWGNVSERFGIFRVEPLKDNIALNKRHVMALLRAAYTGLKLSRFEDAVAFCRMVGIKLGYYEKGDTLAYLAW